MVFFLSYDNYMYINQVTNIAAFLSLSVYFQVINFEKSKLLYAPKKFTN